MWPLRIWQEAVRKWAFKNSQPGGSKVLEYKTPLKNSRFVEKYLRTYTWKHKSLFRFLLSGFVINVPGLADNWVTIANDVYVHVDMVMWRWASKPKIRQPLFIGKAVGFDETCV